MSDNWNEDWLRTRTWDVCRPDGEPCTTLDEVVAVLGGDRMVVAHKILDLPFGRAAPTEVRDEALAVVEGRAPIYPAAEATSDA